MTREQEQDLMQQAAVWLAARRFSPHNDNRRGVTMAELGIRRRRRRANARLRRMARTWE